eukprot:GHRR01005599.1.p1 GENE.GHRR01005599.1~~GHRR01005599.1.p1  ORF type:complete len:445 (+),score=184.70 GHRR01005599.1:92-1336(+)
MYTIDKQLQNGQCWGSRQQAAHKVSNSSQKAHIAALGLLMLPQERKERGKRLADAVEACIGAVYLTAAAAAAASGTAGSSGSTLGSGRVPVSGPGLAAAAAFCEAVGVLPQGAAALACKTSMTPFQSPTSISQPQRLQRSSSLQLLQQPVLGYSFRQPELLQQAVTHVTVLGAISYQRLEFLGDAVLDLLVSAWIMQRLAAQMRASSATSIYAPAIMTRGRAALVNNTNLARAAAAAGLHKYIKFKARNLAKNISMFVSRHNPVQDSIKAMEVAAPGSPHKHQQEQPQLADWLYAPAGAAAVATGTACSVVNSNAVPSLLQWSERDLRVWRDVWDPDSTYGAARIDGSTTNKADHAEGQHKQGDNGWQRAPKALADVAESIIGAALIDSNVGNNGNLTWTSAWGIIQRLLPTLV